MARFGAVFTASFVKEQTLQHVQLITVADLKSSAFVHLSRLKFQYFPNQTGLQSCKEIVANKTTERVSGDWFSALTDTVNRQTINGWLANHGWVSVRRLNAISYIPVKLVFWAKDGAEVSSSSTYRVRCKVRMYLEPLNRGTHQRPHHKMQKQNERRPGSLYLPTDVYTYIKNYTCGEFTVH